MAVRTDAVCTRCADRAALICTAGNIFLCVIKAVMGILTGSLALVADAIHSGADVLVSVVTIFAVHIGQKPPDTGHPYGHGKTEFISGAFVGLVLFIGAACIIASAIGHLLRKATLDPPHFTALAAAAVSIALNELLYHYAHCAASRTNSSGLEALAWDNRSDAISSMPVFFGVLGALLGFPLLDPLAALLVGLLVGKIGWEILAENIGALMDAPLHSDQIDHMKQLVLAVPSVHGIGYLRTRGMGRDYLVDLQILVNAATTVERSHDIANKVRTVLRRKIEHLSHITVTCQPRRGDEQES
ncbi:cation diffusion facilitator family transporter [Verrucomicrobiota bacterium]